jgi:hypothetical protein
MHMLCCVPSWRLNSNRQNLIQLSLYS